MAERLDAGVPGAFPDVRSLSLASVASHQTSLAQRLYDRRTEYTRPRTVRIKVGTWNTGAQKNTEHDVGAWFVTGKGVDTAKAGLGIQHDDAAITAPAKENMAAQEARQTPNAPTIPLGDTGAVPGGPDVDLYVLGLQEIVDITSPAEALRPYTDPSVAARWKTSLQGCLPLGYHLVAEQQLIGLWLVVYAAPHLAGQIKNVSTTSVGTGLMGYMGNKGAVTVRIVLGETTRLVFINAHLAAGADKAALERRNWDVAQINTRTRFDPIVDALGSSNSQPEGLGTEDFAFWFGDLNYRLQDMSGEDVRRLLTVHTKDIDTGSEGCLPTSADTGYTPKQSLEETPVAITIPEELDPTSLHTTISSLLPHDELRQQMKTGKAFHDGWEEGPVRFLPSYKYDIGKVGVFDSSEKRRCPSWCDRILYRTRAAKQRYEAKVKEKEDVRKKDDEMKAKGLDAPGDDDVLYDYNPDTDGDTYDEYDETEDPVPEPITTKDDLSAEILLEYYTTHMRVLSSDHKPLDAVFSLQYDAVVPELKAAIHAEVTRELDRQENEGRPSIAVVVERATGISSEEGNKTDSSFEGVDFQDVKFGKSKRRNITIANTGRVPATFGFADRPVDKDQPTGPFPPWLSVTFDREPDKPDKSRPDDIHRHFTLAPADVLNVELKLKIENVTAVRDLNAGDSLLDEVLVIRVENGRDHFLPVRAQWLPSVLARSIDKLIQIPEGGIRKLQNQIPARGEVKWSVPREMFRLTGAIEDLTERTLAEWEMTKAEGEKGPWQDNAGWPFVTRHPVWEEHEEELADVYDTLDCDTPFSSAFAPETRAKEKVEILAHVLLTLLGSLTDGVITPSLWERLEESLLTRTNSRNSSQPHPPPASSSSSSSSSSPFSDEDEKMAILEILATAPCHNASFLLLLSFLQNLANQIAELAKAKPEDEGSKGAMAAVELPASPQAKVRRRTLSKVPQIAVRQLIVRNYAVVFAGVLIRAREDGRIRERERAARKERMVGVVELFLGMGT